MVGGIHTHMDDMLASQYQSIDWSQHTTLSFLIHGTRSQKVPPTEILLGQVLCWVQSIDWYCDASTSSKWV